MSEKKEQKIVVLTALKPEDKTLILSGIKVAAMFKKELCLVYNYPKKEQKKHGEYKAALQNYLEPVKKEIPGLKASVLLTSKKTGALPKILAVDYEAILLIAASADFRIYTKAIAETPVPFLFVKVGAEISELNKIILPVDVRRETSDSALWTSYFGRFNGAETVVIAASEKNRDDQKEVAKNVVLTKKLFQKFKLRHKVYKGQRSSWRNAFEAMEFAKSSGSNLFVLLGSSSVTPIDYLIGLPERKLLKMAGEIPVLYVNPRKDNYILCD